MCGDIIDKTDTETLNNNAVYECKSGCNDGKTGCKEYPDAKGIDMSSHPQICDEQNKPACSKDGQNAYLCINEKEVIDLKNVNFCEESSDLQPQQEYQPCTDSLSSIYENNHVIRCDVISGMQVKENCQNTCKNNNLICNIGDNEIVIDKCDFGCNEDEKNVMRYLH